MASVEDRVKKIVVKQLGLEDTQVKGEAKFIEDLGADSLDIVELVMAMEDEFEVSIPEDQAEKLMTVNDAVTYVAQL